MKTLFVAFSLIFSASAFAAPDCVEVSRFEANPVKLAEMKTIAAHKSATIIDVNSKKSFDKAHIGNAIHFMSNKDKIASLLPKDKNAPIVAYCGGPSCTAWKRAAMAACKAGYTNIRHFPGGITKWKSS